MLADACVAFKQANRAVEAEVRTRQIQEDDIWFGYETEAEYIESGYYDFLTDADIHPHLIYTKADYGDDDTILASYTVEVFDPTVPRYTVRKRLNNYVSFLDGEEWQSETDEEKPPIAMFICPTKADMIYCKRATKKLLEDAWDTENIHLRFTTVEMVKKHGFRGKIWEEVEAPKDDD